MEPLIHLDYFLDKALLLKEADKAKISAAGYTDSRYPNLRLDNWLIGRYNSQDIQKIINDFDVEGRPRFYWLKPYAVIPTHVDNETKCSINIILTDEAAPVTINNKDYNYNTALLNTTLPHSVKNNQHERIMLKISIFNETFEELAARIKFKR